MYESSIDKTGAGKGTVHVDAIANVKAEAEDLAFATSTAHGMWRSSTITQDSVDPSEIRITAKTDANAKAGGEDGYAYAQAETWTYGMQGDGRIVDKDKGVASIVQKGGGAADIQIEASTLVNAVADGGDAHAQATGHVYGMDKSSITASGGGSIKVIADVEVHAGVSGSDQASVSAEAEAHGMSKDARIQADGGVDIEINAGARSSTSGVDYNATASWANAYGMIQSEIETGGGKDSITIEAIADAQNTANAYGMSDSSIDTGAGGAGIIIKAFAGASGGGDDDGTAASASPEAYGLAGASSIRTGKGSDTIEITANIQANASDIASDNYINAHIHGGAVGMSGGASIEKTGAGDADITITTGAVDDGGYAYSHFDATAMESASISRIDGDSADITTIILNAAAVSSNEGDKLAEAIANGGYFLSTDKVFAGGMANSNIDIDKGTTNIDIKAVASVAAKDISDVAQDAVDRYEAALIAQGKDPSKELPSTYAPLAADGSPKASAYGMFYSNIQTGVGNDIVAIEAIASGINSTACGMSQSSIEKTGDGTSDIRITATGESVAYGMQNSEITIAGNDKSTIEVTATFTDGTAATGMEESQIQTGGGDDFVHIIGTLHSSSIDTGDGDDVVWIDDSIFGGSIDLGEGNDFLMLRGDLSGGVDLRGGGNERIEACDDDGVAHLGDILGLTSTNLDSFDSDHTTTIHGFEALLVELGSSENLDHLLEGFEHLSGMQEAAGGYGANGDNHLVSLVLTGSKDNMDSLVRKYDGKDLGDAKHEGVEIEGRTGELYDHYEITHTVCGHEETINLYILTNGFA
jgi:hypothetical protein